MKVFFAALALVTVIACGKKSETVAVPVNPQITDAVTQSSGPVLQSLPENKPVEILQSRPEPVVCLPDAGSQ